MNEWHEFNERSISMDWQGKTMTTYDGSTHPSEACYQLTKGEHAGSYVSCHDSQKVAFSSRGFHFDIWLRSDEPAILEELELSRDMYGTLCHTYDLRQSRFHGGALAFHTARWVHERQDYMLHSKLVFADRIDGGIWIYPNNTSYHRARNTGEYHPDDELSYDVDTGEYLYNCPDMRLKIQAYHRSAEPEFKNGNSSYGIGFEVEKDNVLGSQERGDPVPAQPLFAGWETDSSCGVEGITNVYDPIDGFETFMKDLRDSDLVNSDTNATCGGHVNISGPRAKVNMPAIRQYAPLIYSLYRKRLNCQYSSQNKKLEQYYDSDEHYCAITQKRGGFFEFRLVPMVKNAEQLEFRFKLFSILANALKLEWSYENYLTNSMPLLLGKFGESRTNEYMRFSQYFKDYIDNGVINPNIRIYI